MNVSIMPSAINDLNKGYLFYEMQQAGLGNYFQNTLFLEIDSLAYFGGIHRKSFSYYIMLSKRFPFGIYYSREKNVINVHAVLDCRRDPRWIKKKLQN